MENLPFYIGIFFALTTFITIWFFYRATNHSKTTLIILVAWLALQTVVSLTGFYTVTNSLPPRFILLPLPAILFIVGLFITSKGRQFIDGLDLKWLTLLHTIRIPVEIVLFLLFINKVVPEIMTFEGRNLDILSGISAPIIYYFGFVRKQMNKKIILVWNFICLGLLFNIVTIAVLSAPFPFQKFAFDQPNVGLLYFPFVWLPCCVVPLVLLGHLASIKKCLNYDSLD